MNTELKEKAYSKELNEKLDKFKSVLSEIQALSVAGAVASWDIETQMPKLGSEYRGWVLSILTKINHEKLISEDIESSLQYLRREENNSKLNKVDKAIVRVIGREYDKDKKIPVKLIQELSELTSKSHVVWAEAKAKNDYKSFSPHLGKIFSIKKEIAEYIGYEEDPYDALVDSYEEKMTAKKLDSLFESLKADLIPVLKKIKESSVKINNAFLEKKYPSDEQIELSKDLLKYIGYEFDKGRLDTSNHPFTIGLGPNDVRVTTHIKENNIMSNIGSSIHEGGHGLYEQGVDPNLGKTCVGSGASLGIHESQSRFYETIIGQGMPFWKGYFPKLVQRFPEQLKGVTLEDFYRAINIVTPSFIRVESDEVTYNLHIVVRYEMERALLSGEINSDDIPALWSEKMDKYLGIKPATDTEGCLQDVHWSWGAIGYFPTYTIGNLCAAQFYNTLKKQQPNLEDEIASGNLKLVRSWLGENIHNCGMLETPQEIIRRVNGEDLNSKYFVEYINQKYKDIYGW